MQAFSPPLHLALPYKFPFRGRLIFLKYHKLGNSVETEPKMFSSEKNESVPTELNYMVATSQMGIRYLKSA
jgi:hypothetical protein